MDQVARIRDFRRGNGYRRSGVAGNLRSNSRFLSMQRVGFGAGVRRDTMTVEMGSALAFMRWHGMREFRNASQNQIIFWVVAGMAVLALLVWTVQRRRRRWF